MMVTDHTAAGTELQTLATSKSITLPTAMDQKHQSAMTKLGGESGAAFDRDYMKQMVNDHEKTLSLLQKQADKGTDADLKAFAAKMVPIVQGHLTAARNLSTTLGNGGGNSTAASTGNSGMNMNSTRNSNSNTRKSGNSNRKTNTNSGNMNGNSNGNSNRE
jgi:putative membrane protein